MLVAIVAFLASLLVTLFIVRSSTNHAHLSSDHDLSGPQKFHVRPVPRVGGVGIVGGLMAGLAVMWIQGRPDAAGLAMLGVCAIPAFASGLAEDITKKVSAARRLLFTLLSALIAAFAMNAVITRTGFNQLDWLVAWQPAAVAISILAVAGITNAVNIIDGFNGLASMCVVLMLAAIGYVAFQVGDFLVLYAALVCVAAVAGFFIWNFPAGLIFLGDGGAYFLGFIVAELCLLLLQRNPAVSPMFCLLVCIYPVFETLFSIYRKRLLRNMSPGVPDGVHLHMLVYKRLMRWTVGTRDAQALTRRNSLTSPYLWGLSTASVVPAVLFWDDTWVLLAFIALFALTYVRLYWSIVRFRAPKWLIKRR